MNPMQELVNISSKVPLEVLQDVYQRIGDWLAMGGEETDPYIEQQLLYAKKFIKAEE
ncbi:DUF6877 family protein [Paenibacillus sp. SYP-B4298]|uniref:DUF6877 family protein n=1 Tax=Paenibacillus sp. SYP-B4298 TaxID=2996034 RepID=UPI0022DCEFEB|nr:DUF6877 family protein [Paenibacillus sp. SYP-B4298]